MQQAALLGAAGFPELGLAHLRHFAKVRDPAASAPRGMRRIHAWVLSLQGYWSHELAALSTTLQQDALNQARGNP